MSILNPCPICGSEVESNISFGTAQINCKNHDCIMIGCIMMNEPFVDEIENKWNESYSKQEIAKLKAENEKLKALILYTDPALSNEQCGGEIQLKQWNEFIRCFPQEALE